MTLNGRNVTLAEIQHKNFNDDRPIYSHVFLPPPIYSAKKCYKNWSQLHCLFLQERRFGRSRSCKVIDAGANRKHVCNYLLDCNSNLGPILHRFGDFAAFMCSLFHPYSNLMSASTETLNHSAVKLFSKYPKRCEKHTSTLRTDGQTDTERDDMQSHNRTLRSIAR